MRKAATFAIAVIIGLAACSGDPAKSSEWDEFQCAHQ